ncbi:uncharacterized protein F5891DRAFT_1210570 [Suillus fuscotomentosus]|uniref:Uncharacterized protein n=1 Tax=Suillus fuscotomentosus TaxID=1912939 RepID=A0AAD4ECM5_9AGAM|nr:uncharacterized protein F5891DRAFT_1210570 [Suillus fuscotomentosus]KAG1903696.1 hypothetical protein F5891DRAFT_1210570 [Suillus fuscotomentosus]
MSFAQINLAFLQRNLNKKLPMSSIESIAGRSREARQVSYGIQDLHLSIRITNLRCFDGGWLLLYADVDTSSGISVWWRSHLELPYSSAVVPYPPLSAFPSSGSSALNIILPFQTVAAFHRVKFHAINAHGHRDSTVTVDSVHCQPPRKDKRRQIVPARFDTVLVNEDGGGTTGVDGYRVAQVRTIFTLTSQATAALFRTPGILPTHFAYVEWFTRHSGSLKQTMSKTWRLLADL